MAAKLFYLPFPTAFTSNGLPAPGARLFFYESGTSTPADTYSDAALTIEQTHPVRANGAGRVPSIYLDEALTYRLVIQDKNGALLEDIDPYIPGTIAGFGGGEPGTPSLDEGTWSDSSTIIDNEGVWAA